MRKMNYLVVSIFLVWAVGKGQGNTQDKPIEPVRKKMMDLVKNGEVPSISVAVAKSGKIIWEESFGWANREEMIRATPDTMYSLASISKTITATGVMTLVKEGKIDLQASVNKYIAPSRLTAIEGNSDSITISHLLHHTSGLPMHTSLYYTDGAAKKPSIEEMIVRYGFAVHPAGTIYEYSNLGYGILGHIISKVSGQSFGSYIKNKVFLPLGMLHSSLNIGPGLGKYAATRYDKNNNPIPFYDSNHEGASCFYCSIHDLIKFAMFHLQEGNPVQEQILSHELLNQMHSERDPDLPIRDNEYYSFGLLNTLDENGYHILGHDGGMPGVSTTLDLIPSEDMAIVILMNCGDRRIYSLRSDLLGVLLPKYGENSRKGKDQENSDSEDSDLKSSLTGEWEGVLKTYEGEIPVSMEFQDDGDIFVTVKSSPLEAVCPKKLNRVSFWQGRLQGIFSSNVPTGDAMRYRHFCVLRAYLRNDRLVGFVTAVSNEKISFMDLSSYINLGKKNE